MGNQLPPRQMWTVPSLYLPTRRAGQVSGWWKSSAAGALNLATPGDNFLT